MLPLIPVLDVQGGQAVQAIAGDRQHYRPVQSLLCKGSSPVALTRVFVQRGLETLYLADLDALEGGQPSEKLYGELLACGAALLIDAGLKTAEQAQRLAELSPAIHGVIAGLETLPDEAALAAMLDRVGAQRLVLSLDLRAGVPLARSAHWRGWTAEAIVERAVALGLERLIVLDLARVGLGAGTGTESLCRTLRKQHPTLNIIAGGGVQDHADLERLASAGCHAALVASALHQGKL